MGEVTAIEWADHTLNPCRSEPWLRVTPERRVVRELMAAHAQGDSVSNIEPEVGVPCKRADVVGVQVSPSVITAVGAGEPVSSVNVIAPALEVAAGPQPTSVGSFAINIAWRIDATRRVCSRSFADQGSCLGRMLMAKTITRAVSRGGAHLCPALIGHAGATLNHG